MQGSNLDSHTPKCEFKLKIANRILISSQKFASGPITYNIVKVQMKSNYQQTISNFVWINRQTVHTILNYSVYCLLYLRLDSHGDNNRVCQMTHCLPLSDWLVIDSIEIITKNRNGNSALRCKFTNLFMIYLVNDLFYMPFYDLYSKRSFLFAGCL